MLCYDQPLALESGGSAEIKLAWNTQSILQIWMGLYPQSSDHKLHVQTARLLCSLAVAYI